LHNDDPPERHRRPERGLASLLLFALMLGAWTWAAPARADALDRQLVKEAGAVLDYLREMHYQNVGVLKFRVQRAGQAATFNAGPLNAGLADRLENALILANDPAHPVGILHEAGNAAYERARGGDSKAATFWTNPDGRRHLLAADYPLAWGGQKVKADAFVTGAAQVGKDLRTLTVSLFVFDRTANRLVQVGDDFTTANDAGQLGEMGESFLLRGAFDDPSLDPGTARLKALRAAVRVKSRETPFPLEDRNCPVALEIRYDGQVVPPELRDGKAFVPEPMEGQKVSLVLKRDGGEQRYGVVLKVNGENTLGRQRLPDLRCTRWILDPGAGPLTIRGYQTDDRQAQEFRVLSREESEANEMNYGADVGTITMTVFGELRGKEPPPDLSDEETYATAVSLGKLPPETAANFAALKAQLLEDSSRGLIGQGETIGSTVQRVKFKPDPTPLMSVTIVYYQRRQGN
jgi:hypothetical protein